MNRKAVQNVHARMDSLNVQCRLMARRLTASQYFANNATDQQHCVLLTYNFASYSRLCNWRFARAILPYSVFVYAYGGQLRQPHLRKAQSGSLMPCVMRAHMQNAGRTDYKLITNSRLINTCVCVVLYLLTRCMRPKGPWQRRFLLYPFPSLTH